MSLSRTNGAIQHIHTLYASGTVTGASDGELLDRFIASRDAIAFEALLARHGPMVLAVCRSVLGDVPSSDDAFQATFLILVKKARAVQVQDSLGRWLHGVSRRVAIRASKRDALARKRASGDPRHLASFNIDEEDRREVRAAIHEEVNRLPASIRAPILACYFEGLTHEQAAAHLRWPVGTVKGRLSRARRMLRDRLTRRGIGITTGVIMATLSYPSAKAAVPLSLIKSTVKAAIGFAAGRAAIVGTVPAASYLLAKGALNAMAWTKIATAAAVLGSLITGVASYAAVGQSPGDKPAAESSQIAAPAAVIEQSISLDEDALRLQVDFLDRKAKSISARLSKMEIEHASYEESHNALLREMANVQRESQTRQAMLASKIKTRTKDPFPLRAADDKTFPIVYSVADLVTDSSKSIEKPDASNIGFEPLIDLIQSSVAPGTWKRALIDEDKKLIGSITPFYLNASLIIRHTPDVHRQIVERLRQLRRLHGRLKTEHDTRLDVINPPDLLIVNVPKAPPDQPLEGERLVRPDGTITLGDYGDLHVAGRAIPEIKTKIVTHLRKYFSDTDLGIADSDLTKASGVEVTLAARNSVAYYVLGMVKTPGRFPIDENLTVLDALQRSGGLNKIERNDAAIRLVREAVNGNKPQTLSIDLRGIMTFGDTTTNYQILPGDRIYVYSMESFKEGAESSTLSTNPPK